MKSEQELTNHEKLTKTCPFEDLTLPTLMVVFTTQIYVIYEDRILDFLNKPSAPSSI
jgi:hypothetical protein